MLIHPTRAGTAPACSFESALSVLQRRNADGLLFCSRPQVIAIGETPHVEPVRELYRRSVANQRAPLVSANCRSSFPISAAGAASAAYC
jgi:hypothetical protein